MTAVHGIDLLPPRESQVSSPKGNRSDNPIRSFDDYLKKEKVSSPEREEKRAPVEMNEQGNHKKEMLAERAEEPVQAQPSAEKVASLLKSVKKLSKDEEASHKIVDFSLHSGKSNSNKMNLLHLGQPQLAGQESVENQIKLISRFLKGHISPEELAQLSVNESEANKILNLTQPIDSENLMASLSLKGEENQDGAGEAKILKGFMTEEGLVYYGTGEMTDRELRGTTSAKGLTEKVGKGDSENKILMEINVTDLREVTPQGQGEKLVSLERNIDPEAGAEGESFEDLLSQPNEKLISAEGAGGKLQAPVTKEVSNLFQSYMKEKGTGELVRKIDFLLKDNNAGEIKLILKPEALGNVRINLSLSENHIAGKIFVDNSSVRDIFLKNMDQFTSLLQENGYDDATIEVFVGQDGNQENNQEQNETSEEDKHIQSVKGMKKLDDSVPHSILDGSAQGEVNLVI